ncbi:DNA polymerase III subunit delta' [Gimesia aquarii]|uniref:DNA polymerase III subunit tau n=1 Tax=Gimesia aquarii TaxID=2527964 RepID=A0A517VTT9_9PLAN|nr:DNA polymerase III subunit delta' [Gimesia aquarii]QDT96389.1 DNA polymerase III subunit tau [Gimesia aquarii]
MIANQIRGHQLILEMLDRSLSRSRLPHALLFVGDAGIGKKRVAQHLAQCLFCQQTPADQLVCCNVCNSCKQMAAGTHPDLISVECPPDKAVLPLNLIIGKDEQRGREGICYEMSLRPMLGDRRIAIIDDADKMNAESANALLKTLEEPSANYLMILIANELDAILPTIRSRCQSIRFRPLSDEDVAELLIEQQLVDSDDRATQVARLAEGSLNTARQLLDESLEELRVNITRQLIKKPFQPQVFAQSVIQAIDDIGGETATQRKTAKWIIKFCADFYHQAIQYAANYDLSSHSEQIGQFIAGFSDEPEDRVEKIGNLLDRMILTEEQISQNATITLCIESLSEDLRKIQKL